MTGQIRKNGNLSFQKSHSNEQTFEVKFAKILHLNFIKKSHVIVKYKYLRYIVADNFYFSFLKK
eukprot:UN21789